MRNKTILIIDNDTETIQKIMSTLESKDYLVFTASSKDVGVQMARKINPSLIFVNIGMSGTSGLEICKVIHDTEILKNVPIVIITPHGGTLDSRYTVLYGIIDFLKKPFSSEELISKTMNVLAVKSVEAQPAEEKVGVRPTEEEIDSKLFEKEEVEAELKEKLEVKPFEEEVEALLVEEEIKAGKDKEPAMEKEIPDIQKDVPEEVVTDKTEIENMIRKIDEEEAEQIKEPVEAVSDSTVLTKDQDVTYISEKNKRNRLFVPIIIIALIIIGAAGIIEYRSLWQGTKVQTPVLVKPSKPVQQEAVKVEPAQEQQKPQQTEESKPVTPQPLPAPAPLLGESPEATKAKPEVKPVYSVQAGVFKNESNAAALTKKYTEMGYNAFTYKSTIKDKGVLYRVLIGNFKNKKEAAELADSIRTKEKIDVIIFH